MIESSQVVALLGRDGDTELAAVAERALPIVTAQVRAYTRGRGFSGDQPAPDVETVILTSTARLAANPENLRAEKIGDYEVQRQVIDGWTLPELAILGRYRRRAR
ncbi:MULTISPECIES: hypothetical protein [Gordonia]|uniref:hypothetical protein n=1 Tax=Gordonia TaxID=2053 RepID=UPI000466B6D6|nr:MULTISPECIES: hypothetical protein [Gordonia]ATD70354.1 hypothetical protein CNO18_08780 [Gordonia sp. 1D]ATD71863.1 hypothetical protein CNO18_17965 [Gordonia sp. 1D]KAF0968371.1 hypothetical protein BPODLACK_03033 [Gordonia sp. YY1]MBA5848593.1 hypothetical protein [Gordonia amicalis]MCK8615861.1 hypothetical protein [Gordonia sp. C13]